MKTCSALVQTAVIPKGLRPANVNVGCAPAVIYEIGDKLEGRFTRHGGFSFPATKRF
jgi:hypothetical protein